MSLEHGWTALNASYQELTGSFTDAMMPTARVVHVGDRNLAARENWLAVLYPDLVSAKYNEFDTTLLSSASGDFQLFILHGDDIDRMSKIIRRNIEVLAGKIKIALCTRSYPPDRARLLNSGFDDVFDLRMDPVEAFARINAMQRRRYLAMRSALPDINKVLLEEINQYTTQRLILKPVESDSPGVLLCRWA